MDKHIQEKDWKWFGNVAHLCVGSRCRFHLATQIGDYVISTVGEYFPEGSAKMDTIGGRPFDFYETMVFKIEKYCSEDWCGKCGIPIKNQMELFCERYVTAREANEGHMRFCYVVARGDTE